MSLDIFSIELLGESRVRVYVPSSSLHTGHAPDGCFKRIQPILA